MAAAPPAPEQRARTLTDVLAEASAWATALATKHLDAGSRRAVYLASPACQTWVLGAAAHAAVTLIAYDGMSPAVWQRRLACAERGLMARGLQHRGTTTLILHLPTPNHAAQQSVLSLAPVAGAAVTELDLRQCPAETGQDLAHTDWLHGLPAAFPHLRSLRVSRLCGRLPPPAVLTHLRELHLHLVAAQSQGSTGCSIAEMCASIAPYLPQITTLTLSSTQHRLPWASVFSVASTTLTHFTTPDVLTDELVGCLCEYAPGLVQLGCSSVSGKLTLTGKHAESTWRVKHLSCECVDIEHGLARLPRPPAGGAVLVPSKVDGPLVVYFDYQEQGLDAEVIARMHQWRIEAPCTVYIHPAWSPLEVSLEGLALALQQLSQVIPPGCDIMVYVSESISLSATAAVLAAAAPLMPPQTTLWPDVRCELVEESQAVCDPGQGYTNMCMRQLSLNGDRYAHVAWLWQKLKFRVTPMVKQLLQLPDPRGGQYEIDVQGLIVCEKQFTPDMVALWEHRLQHWTFLASGEVYITLSGPYTTPKPPSEHPALLREQLQLLRGCRWRQASAHGRLTVCLETGHCLQPCCTSYRPCQTSRSQQAFRSTIASGQRAQRARYSSCPA